MTQAEVEKWMASGKGRRLHCEYGLYLCRNARGFSWAAIWMKDGRRREHGLGAYVPQGVPGVAEMRLREARWASVGIDKLRKEGRDVIAVKRQQAKVQAAVATTFSDVAETYIKDVGLRTWKADRQEKAFRRILATYCKALCSMPVADVGVSDVKRVLEPWVIKRPTMVASVASVIRRVLDTAFALELRPLGVNPASEDVLSKILVVRHKTKHFAALGWQAAPTFYQVLGHSQPEIALRLLMLTALRRNEVTGLRWREVDLDAATITVEAVRMKAAREHVVPLSTQAVELLKAIQSNRRPDSFVFPSPRIKGQSIASTAFVPLMGPSSGATPHGMRATFRGWCEDHGVDHTLAEHALAHAMRDDVAKAYRRTTALELRRKVMQDWADHLTGSANATTGNPSQ